MIQTRVYVSKVERSKSHYDDRVSTTLEVEHDSKDHDGPRLMLEYIAPGAVRLVLQFRGDEQRIEPGDRLVLTIEKAPPLPESTSNELPF